MDSKQGDAILDLVDQCNVVVATWQQISPVKGKTAEDTVKAFKKSVIKLSELYKWAVSLSVSEFILVSVLLKGLPVELHGELIPDYKEPVCSD